MNSSYGSARARATSSVRLSWAALYGQSGFANLAGAITVQKIMDRRFDVSSIGLLTLGIIKPDHDAMLVRMLVITDRPFIYLSSRSYTLYRTVMTRLLVTLLPWRLPR